MKNYCVITGLTAAAGAIQFLAMVEAAEYANTLAFYIYGLLCLVQTANLASFLTRVHCSGQRIGAVEITAVLLGGALLAALIWLVVMLNIIS